MFYRFLIHNSHIIKQRVIFPYIMLIAINTFKF